MLVIAADDGVMPQTREHLAIMDLLGLRARRRRAQQMRSRRPGSPGRRDARHRGYPGRAPALRAPTSSRCRPSPEAGCDDCWPPRPTLAADRSARPARGARSAWPSTAPSRCTASAPPSPAPCCRVRSPSDDHVVVSPSGLEARVRSIHAQDRPAGPGRGRPEVRARAERSARQQGDRASRRCRARPRSARTDRSHRCAPARAGLGASADRPVVAGARAPCGHRGAGPHRRAARQAIEARMRRSTCSWCSSGRSRPRPEIASSCAIPRRAARSAAVSCSTCALRSDAAGRRSGAPLAAMPEREPEAALAGLLPRPGAGCDVDAFARDRALPPKRARHGRRKLSLVTTRRQRPVVPALLPSNWGDLRNHRRRRSIGSTPPARSARASASRNCGRRPEAAAARHRSFRRRCASSSGKATLRRPHLGAPARHEVRFSPTTSGCGRACCRCLAVEPLSSAARARYRRKTMQVDESFVRRLLRLAARRGDVEEIAHDHYFLYDTGRRDGRIATRAVRSPRPRGLRSLSFAIGLTTAARLRSKSSNSSIATASRCAAAICAASIRRASSLFGPRAKAKRHVPSAKTEESRSRWGDRTSNPGGAVRRSQVGSTPILLRQPLKRSADETRFPSRSQ